MSVDSIRAYCLSFLRTTEKLLWGDALWFKVGGKMFAVLGLDRLRLSFKCTPDSFAELIERQNIRPSPYVGRYKWVMLDRLDALRDDEMEDLIRQSYEMVAAKALKSRSGKAEGKKKGGRRKPIKAQARKRK